MREGEGEFYTGHYSVERRAETGGLMITAQDHDAICTVNMVEMAHARSRAELDNLIRRRIGTELRSREAARNSATAQMFPDNRHEARNFR